ncbi:fatty acid desaturase family protein [Merismopedia glauca]|uniref:Fatty acid desaturase n=1 Tax=Merismopedia glauca CCAP 1448/3 TaxID=1296344 RepID=A0A2T1C8K1_9CYAN|nr:fatty acid desaturase [Merismopedia glauca]PSB04574.1 fatty acid desaturase [Merismopedia glauca CCAP 1448/3]
MNSVDTEIWITQAEYAKKLRPMLPNQAFLPDPSKIWILLINVAILILGWGIANYLDRWNWYFLWLYLPLSLIMGNSVTVLLFSTHNLLHSSTIKNPLLRWVISLLGLTMLWMPPTLWKAVHNREHHNKTNSWHDPDRSYLYQQPKNWGKWIQNLFTPSAEVNPFFLIIGMGHAWGVYTFRNLTSVLLFNNSLTEYPPAAFQVNSRERRAIALEVLAIIGIHIGILSYLHFHPIKLLLSYFIPIWIGHGGAMFYIYTNHILCRMTSINDPLINSLSLRVPKIFDLLHLNFSCHTEHHVFPGMNSDYYPLVQELLQAEYPDRYNLLDARKAWDLLLQTPRHYKDENTFTDWQGKNAIACPLSARNM